MSGLRLSLLGPPRIECAGEPATIELRKALALLVYLAVTGRSHRRDALATLFWPELDQSRARAGLRYALSALKKALGDSWVENQHPLLVDRETVGLNPNAEVWLDVVGFQGRLAECWAHDHPKDGVCPACIPILTEAAALYRDDFMAGFTLRDSPGFDEWQFFQTEGLRDDLAGVLERLVRGHSALGQFGQAIPNTRRWLALDPLHEPAHRHLMQLYAWSDQRSAALRQYDECKRVLDEELGVFPEEETTRLFEVIRTKRHLPPPEGRIAVPVQATVLNNRYRLDAELGRGSMGIVYRAHDLLLERDVAAKVYSANTLGTEGRARLLDEAQAVAKLNHPNIVSIYDAGDADLSTGSGPYIVTELVEGESLHTRRPEALDEILVIACQVCAALEHAHAHGIVHIPTTLVESTRTLQRRRLHRRAAAAIEARWPDDFEALAHHYQQAGEAEKAADYLLRAGDRARGLYAHQEAIDNYRRALEFLKKSRDLELAARTLMKLGLTYHNAFDFKAARQAYQEGFVLWRRLGEAESAALSPSAPHALRITILEPASLSPGVAMDHPSAVLQDQLFSGLLEVSPDMSVVPHAARSWEVLDGGRKYVFHLRDDIVWSDGVQMTAADFEYAWLRVLAPARRWPAANQLYDIQGARAYHQGEATGPGQVGVRVLDDLTLVVELEGPASYFPYLLAFSPMFPVPRHVIKVHGEAWAEPENIVTNGPFRLVGWERGKHMILERSPTYHGRFSSNLQLVECWFVSGQSDMLLRMYEGDRLDICGDLPPAQVNRARLRYPGEYVSGPRLSIDFVGFDVRRPPFDDPRVRRAFALATDRETLADVTLRGYTFPVTGGFVSPGMPGHSPGIGLSYDPEAARHSLSEAGYPGGHGFPAITCIARDDPGHDLMCEYLGAQWLENLGVEITWQDVEWAKFADRMAEGTPHGWMVGWWADYPDPDDYLRVVWWLPPGWTNRTFDRLVEGARRAVDQEERMSMYRQADKILVEEAPILPLAYLRFHMLVKPWVRRYHTSPLRWWFWKDVIIEPH